MKLLLSLFFCRDGHRCYEHIRWVREYPRADEHRYVVVDVQQTRMRCCKCFTVLLRWKDTGLRAPLGKACVVPAWMWKRLSAGRVVIPYF